MGKTWPKVILARANLKVGHTLQKRHVFNGLYHPSSFQARFKDSQWSPRSTNIFNFGRRHLQITLSLSTSWQLKARVGASFQWPRYKKLFQIVTSCWSCPGMKIELHEAKTTTHRRQICSLQRANREVPPDVFSGLYELTLRLWKNGANSAVKCICKPRLWVCTHADYGWVAGKNHLVTVATSTQNFPFRALFFFAGFKFKLRIYVFSGVSPLPKKIKEKKRKLMKPCE